MQSYEAARGLFKFLGVCSWGVIGIGAIAALTGLGAGGGVQATIGLAVGALVAVAGFYGLALVQMARAGVDSAEYAQQALKVSRDQLELTRQALEQNRKAEATYAALMKRQITPAEQPQEAQETGPSYANRAAVTAEPAPPAQLEEPKLVEASVETPAVEDNKPAALTDQRASLQDFYDAAVASRRQFAE